MKLLFSEQGWGDYQYWLATDKKLAMRINQLIRDTTRDPF
jgi:toxin YoeB